MANLYGVATPNPLPVGAFTIGSVDIVCNAGVETNVITINPNNPTVNGWYYPNFVGYLSISLGATPATSINIGFRLNGGADMAALAISNFVLVASATIMWPCSLQGSTTIVSNPSGVNAFTVSLFPAAQAVTVRQIGSFCQGAWIRATDQ